MKKNEKIKILHLIGAPRPGGAETFAVRLISACSRYEHVRILVVARRGSWVAKRLKAEGIRVIEAPFGGWWDGLLGYGTAQVVREAARSFKPHVVQSWMNRASRFVPAGPWLRVGRLGGFYNLKYYWKKVEYLIGNTPAICDYCVREGWPEDKVAYLTNFGPEPTKGWQKEREAVRKRLKIKPGATVLMVSGRLHKVKGVDVAIRALAKLPGDFVLLLAGEGPEKAALESLAEELEVAKRVRFLGWVNELSPYAAAADFWLVPSRDEPLGNTVLDGWAHGKPVIVSAVGGLTTLVEDGQTGLHVPPDDPEALAGAVTKLMRNEGFRERLAQGGLARWKKYHSEKAVVGAYLRFYRERGSEVAR